MSALLSVRDLRVRYGLPGRLATLTGRQPACVDVVHGVSLDIQPGKTLAVVGESGSGKTTLAKALCGLAPVCGGEVLFDGETLVPGRNRLLKPDRERLALMLQDPVGSLSPRMTVRKLLAEPFRIHRPGAVNPDREALGLLELVGLDVAFANRYPHQLSGGQARRVGVARALALRPDILIADEPTAGLDVSIQGDVLNLLSRLQEEMGLGILIITHNLNIVRHVSDHMAIMYLGRFVEQGESQQIFDHPMHPYTAALLSANPSADLDAERQRVELTGDVPSLLSRPSGCEFHTRCPQVQPLCRREFPTSTSAGGEHVFNCHFPME